MSDQIEMMASNTEDPAATREIELKLFFVFSTNTRQLCCSLSTKKEYEKSMP